MARMVECPRCAGYGHDDFDEAGAPYACYFCGTSGLVPEAALIEERRDAHWAAHVGAEKAIETRIALGVPPGWSYRFDEWEGIILVPPRAPAVAPAWPPRAVTVGAEEFDDIPF